MILPNLTPSLLYALLSLNPAAVTTLASTPSNSQTSAALRQDTSSSSSVNTPHLTPRSLYQTTAPQLSSSLSILRHSSSPHLTRRSRSHTRQEIPVPIQPSATIVNATVSCREGEFQNPGDDIASIVCGDYYNCAGGAEAERDDPDGEGGEVAVWTATCFSCEAGQAPDRASGCVYTET